MKRADIERLLPDIFQRTLAPGRPLMALLEVMEDLHEPSETILAELDQFFDAHRTPDRFVPFLARWVNLEWLVASEGMSGTATPRRFSSGTGRLRELVLWAVYLSRWRGTARGLRDFLEIATGLSGFQVDENVPDEAGTPRPFHLRIVCPPDAASYQVLIDQIVSTQKPAYATYQLDFGATPNGGAP